MRFLRMKKHYDKAVFKGASVATQGPVSYSIGARLSDIDREEMVKKWKRLRKEGSKANG